MNIHPVDTATVNATDKRDRILDAALSAFAERGFHGTPVPLIAERAKVGAGTIYRYFESKEALVNALYRRSKLAFLDQVSVGFPADKSPRQQWGHIFRCTLDFATKSPEAFDFLEMHHHAPYLDDESRALEARVWGMAQQILGASRLLQLTRNEEPTLLISLVWGGVIRLVRCAREGLVELSPSVVERFENLCWESIRA
jgi:AcrR family transcriptional regulator